MERLDQLRQQPGRNDIEPHNLKPGEYKVTDDRMIELCSTLRMVLNYQQGDMEEKRKHFWISVISLKLCSANLKKRPLSDFLTRL